ncbi:TRAP transporter substrate-binding protein [Nocardioides campestrisoli]|uniref:TRAP transporter substrate-binding protein n=1 Tax=Nocardioides campestrisoli TaxID=2736757 RepID=UPI0015E76EC2|nr:hypothetical protein [Nocardioides campestrisoli]
MDPVTLKVNTNQAPGVGNSIPAEAYGKAVEEWSGGKITFDIVYSGAVVPLSEASQAMADGLLDAGLWGYGTRLDFFPVAAAKQETFFLQDSAPLSGGLELIASAIAQSADDDLRDEIKTQDLYPLLPMLPFAGVGMICKGDPLEGPGDAQGKTVRAAGTAGLAEEVKALGMTPVEIPFAEAYDAMQRGVTECEANALNSFASTGQMEIADQLILLDGASFTAASAGFDISLHVWESLPLAAQQLLFDRLDVFLASFAEGALVKPAVDVNALAEKYDVQVDTWSSSDVTALTSYHDEKLEAIAAKTYGSVSGKEIVADAEAARDTWREKVAALGLGDDDVAFEDFPQWVEKNDVELQGFFAEVLDEALGEYRPA